MSVVRLILALQSVAALSVAASGAIAQPREETLGLGAAAVLRRNLDGNGKRPARQLDGGALRY
jgi:hypothetical protein